MAKRKAAARAATREDVPFRAPAWPATKPELWRIERIVPYPNNPRSHPPAQVKLLAELMKKRGVDQPIVVDDAGVILKGHGRRLAAIEAGFEEFPVVVHRGLSETDKRAMRIEDNQVSLLSGWNQELVRHELNELKLSNYPLDLLGFGEAQLVSFQTTPGPPAAFPSFGEDIATDYCCPKCGFVWSGKPDGGKVKSAAEEKDDPMRVRMRTKPSGKGSSGETSKVRQRPSLARATKAGKNKT